MKKLLRYIWDYHFGVGFIFISSDALGLFLSVKCPFWVTAYFQRFLDVLFFISFVFFLGYQSVNSVLEGSNYTEFLLDVVVRSEVKVLISVGLLPVYCDFGRAINLSVDVVILSPPPGLRGGAGHFWKIGQRGGAGQFFPKGGPGTKRGG